MIKSSVGSFSSYFIQVEQVTVECRIQICLIFDTILADGYERRQVTD